MKYNYVFQLGTISRQTLHFLIINNGKYEYNIRIYRG